ncbi:FAD-dependent oxidoreductase [Teichococcus cervicalis]|uniref:FAD-dependent oxidoreductase n=1 Tax=Teichococcus cervicalis TaxID=204525 RepID=UPI00058DB0DB|nr:FAD-dependent oxidoreductase [Pseudoroseomonas cervicalis]
MPNALVLGAGIMGLSAAWGLTRAGWSVTIVEQDEIPNPRGASVDEHRLIRHAYGAERGYMRMVDEAYAAWDLLWAELGERLYVPTGVLALGDAGGGWLAESRATLAGDGHAFADLGAAALEARFPMLRAAGVGDAFHMETGGVLLANRIVAALAALLKRRGVTFRRGRATEADPARARLHLEDGAVLEADLLVLAAGPWAPRFLPGLAGRVTASRQIVVYLEPPAGQREAWAQAPMLLDLSAQGGFYAVPPVAGTALKIGDHRFSCQGDAEADPREASAAEAEAILDLARPRLREAAAYRVLGARACYYDVQPEERFLLEPLGERTMLMSGFSGHGFKFGPLLGLAVAAEDRASRAGWAAGRG